jgi:hypothetical protein
LLEHQKSEKVTLSHKYFVPFSQGKDGFSPRNLKYMRRFCEILPDEEIVQRTVAQLP